MTFLYQPPFCFLPLHNLLESLHNWVFLPSKMIQVYMEERSLTLSTWSPMSYLQTDCVYLPERMLRTSCLSYLSYCLSFIPCRCVPGPGSYGVSRAFDSGGGSAGLHQVWRQWIRGTSWAGTCQFHLRPTCGCAGILWWIVLCNSILKFKAKLRKCTLTLKLTMLYLL